MTQVCLVKGGWCICPQCLANGKEKLLLRIGQAARSQGVFVKCKGCKQEIEIRIIDKQSQSREP